jgi:hypothetical protein
MPANVRTARFAWLLRQGVCLGALAACAGAAPAAAQQTVAIVLQVTGGQTNPPLDRFAQIRVGAIVQVPASARLRFIYLPGCRDVDAAGATLTFGAERYEVRGGEAAWVPRRTCPRIEILNSGEGALPAGSMVRADEVPPVSRPPVNPPSGTGQARTAPPVAQPAPPPPPVVAAPPSLPGSPRPSPAPPTPGTPLPTLRNMPPDAVAAPPGSTRPGPDGTVRLTPEAPTRPGFVLLGGYWRRVSNAELRAGGQVVARWTVTSAELAWPAAQPPLQDGTLYTLVLAGATAAETTSFSFRASGRLTDEPVMLTLD